MSSQSLSVSVLIPNYDWDLTDLVYDLHKQLTAQTIPFEIICFDDAQTSRFHKKNQELNALENVFYQINIKPLLRAQNRNALAKKAQHDFVLFLDGDAGLDENPDFISNYLKHASTNTVICGGTGYSANSPENDDLSLRYAYGISREQIPASERQKKSWNGFSAFNFFMPRKTFNKIKFNEALSEYGHEDTLFGNDLKYHCIAVLHIENRALHLGLDSNAVFLAKTRKGVVNLRGLIDVGLVDEDLKLYAWYSRMRKIWMTGLLGKMYEAMHKKWERQLNAEKPNLYIFDLYKLAFLCSLPVNHTAPPKRKI